MPNNDYKALYNVQDSFLRWLANKSIPFYLTGGTALSRFYLHHRYSDDLDFFTNRYNDFLPALQKLIRDVPQDFHIDRDSLMITADFCRFFIRKDQVMLKIEFVNDVESRVGILHETALGLVDNPANILANKLTALMGRDEPKDVFDIITLAERYSFNWQDAFHWAKQKAAINELEVENRLSTFSLTFFDGAAWFEQSVDSKKFEAQRQRVCDDMLTAKTNSLGEGKTPIELAIIE